MGEEWCTLDQWQHQGGHGGILPLVGGFAPTCPPPYIFSLNPPYKKFLVPSLSLTPTSPPPPPPAGKKSSLPCGGLRTSERGNGITERIRKIKRNGSEQSSTQARSLLHLKLLQVPVQLRGDMPSQQNKTVFLQL